jgi:glycosyltransferase involved in cell wall biosynthesis
VLAVITATTHMVAPGRELPARSSEGAAGTDLVPSEDALPSGGNGRGEQLTGPGGPTVAIVHDYLNQRGGAERVVLEMARIWPDAPIYTSIYRPQTTFAEFQAHEVRVSFLDRLPVNRRFRALLPAYPLAFRSFGRLEQDLVISSSTGWAHGVQTGIRTKHAVYCHAPARWLYELDSYVPSRVRSRVLAPIIGLLRRWDQSVSRRPDAFIANAANVRERIRRAYNRNAEVVHPPVDTQRFVPRPRGERLLVVSRLLPYKRIDLVVRAATQAGLGLDVVGVGPALEDLRRTAGSTVEFHGAVDDEQLPKLIENCRGLCVPGAEDFGIVSIEANAAGKPVVAFAARGAFETVADGKTGVLFKDQTVEALLDAIHRADELDFPPEDLARFAERFSVASFRGNLLRVLSRVYKGPLLPVLHR